MNLVFVYGTLQRGCSNHHFLTGQTLVGRARTAHGYTLYDLGSFPGMVRQDNDRAGVSGEVWSVDRDCLARLDELEGLAEGLYRREPVPLGGRYAGQRVEAYIYLKSIEDRRKVGAKWPGP